MKKMFLIFVFSLVCSISVMSSLTRAQAGQGSSPETAWTWLTSDTKYGKFFAPERVRVISQESGIPVCIEAWIKTAYTAEGAAETVTAMKLDKEIPNANNLNYSLALIEINPQGRTLQYKEEIFYDKDGNILTSHKYDKPKLKEINSQSFDENFYDAIVDQVFNQGETARTKADDRWITLWRRVNADTASSATADTTTMRKRGSDVFTWIWQETRNNSTSAITLIKFYKKVYNISSYSYKVTAYSSWTPADGWQNHNASLTGQYSSIIPDSPEDTEYRIVKQYADAHPAWVGRYQLPEAKTAAPAASNKTAPINTPAPAATGRTIQAPAASSPVSADAEKVIPAADL